MNVSQIMSRNVVTCRPEDSLAVAAKRMWDRDVGTIPVVDASGQVLGMLTDRDVCMSALLQGRALDAVQVSSAMSREVFSCSPSDTLIEAEDVMRSHQVRRMPVVDEAGRLAGIVSLNDLAREAERQRGRKAKELSADEVSATLAAVSQPRPSAPVAYA